MLRSLNQSNILSPEYGKLNFITLGNNFRWIINTNSINGFGYIQNGYITATFVSNRQVSSSDNVFIGIKICINYPPTTNRQMANVDRMFLFYNYLRNQNNKIPIPEDLRLYVNENNYQWRSLYGSEGWMVDEELLNRDINLWLLHMSNL